MRDINNSCLVVVDIQGKLASLMHDHETLFKNSRIMINAAHILEMPILWCQQSPKAIGVTVPQIANLLTDIEPIDKLTFSCCQNAEFNERLRALGRTEVLLCGLETHICIYQTACELLRSGFKPTVISDAVSSRTLENKNIAITKMISENIDVASVEMVLFELLKTAEHPNFREIAKLIK